MNGAEQDEIVETLVVHGADMQFRGQTHLIRIPIPSPDVSRATLQTLFEEAYFARFQVRLPEIRAVLVNLVTSVIGRRRSFAVAALADGAGRAPPRQDRRLLYAEGRWQDARVLDRSSLGPGDRLEGPAIIGQSDATTVLEPGAAATVDAVGNLRIQVGRAR